MKLLSLAVLLFVTACAPRSFIGPDGSRWLVAHCGVASYCYARAGEVCPGGYVVKGIQTDERVSITPPMQDGFPGATVKLNSSASISSSATHELMYACK